MSHALQTFERWMKHSAMDEHLKSQLKLMQEHPTEIEERFASHLTFGTGGMRGELGVGTNRLNKFTIRRVTLGLAHYIHNLNEDNLNVAKSVVIAYDCRHFSKEFAEQAALTLAAQGIKAYVFPDLRPTPQLSFAVRTLAATAGIVITASHNPPEYNGYKVYGPDGAQLSLDDGERMISFVEQVHNELDVPVLEREEAEDKGLFITLDDRVDTLYHDYVASLVLQPKVIQEMAEQFKIVFTPLHGTALLSVQQVLQQSGFTQVTYVDEQCRPDPDFSTVESPNPEEHEAFKLAIEYAQREHADLIMGTDPDADRMGIVVRNADGDYVIMNGNQTGALLLHYILMQLQKKGELTPAHTVFKTIVTSELGRVIASSFGLDTEDTLTGFKFIGEKIKQYEQTGERRFVFGYEESYGYLIGDQVRDKDAIQAVLLTAEMGAYYQSQGLTLLDALERLYEKYGYYEEGQIALTFKGSAGMVEMKQLIQSWREQPPQQINEHSVVVTEDYLTGQRHDLAKGVTQALTLPKSDVLKFFLDDGTWVCVRPSGTEPKLKIYMSVSGATRRQTQQKMRAVRRAIHELIQ